jgi:murein DD-endopeptidase MepM/ murein hydrolase activator NlpD
MKIAVNSPLFKIWSIIILCVVVSGCAQYRLPDGARAIKVPEDRDVLEEEKDGALKVRVKKGDSLYKIAKRFRVSLRDLIDSNKISSPYVIFPGQQLVLPKTAEYVVQKEESIYEISRNLGIDPGRLVRENKLFPPYRVQKNQVLKLPAKRILTSSKGSTEKRDNKNLEAQGRASEWPIKSQKNSWSKPPYIELESPPPRKQDNFLWPIKGRILVGFGPRKGGLQNDGINIGASKGTPIRAAESGVVAYSGNQLRGFGNLLLIKHDQGWMTAYAHASILLVGRGDVVKRGQIIGRVGRTGNVLKPQLHFEIRKNNEPVDPQKFLVRLANHNLLGKKRFPLLAGNVLDKLPSYSSRSRATGD